MRCWATVVRCLAVLLASGCAAVATAADDLPAQQRLPAGTHADAAVEAQLKALPREVFEASRYVATDGAVLPYRLLPPLKLVPGQHYPLVVVLHGSGAVGNDNRAQLGALALSWSAPGLRQRYPAYVLVPQFGQRSANYAPASDGALASTPGPGVARLQALVDTLLAQKPIDPARVYVTGFSMGASTAWHALQSRHDRYAAAVMFSGIAPDRNAAVALADVPLLVVHGNADTNNPIDADRAMVEALKAQHAPALHWREYDGMEHQVPDTMLLATEWRDWLWAQQRPRL